MPVNPEKTVRKFLAIPRELWAKVEDFRFAERIGTESEALRRLIEAGVEKLAKPKRK